MRYVVNAGLLQIANWLTAWLRPSGFAPLSGWSIINPDSPSANGLGVEADLNDVALVDDNTIVAVGNRGVIVRSTDFGATWTRPDSGTSRDLFGVAFRDASYGLAVGAWGVILRTTDGGVTWSDLTPGELWSTRDVGIAPNPDGTNYLVVLPTRDYHLRAVAFAGPSRPGRVIAVGDVNYGVAFELRSDDDGATWADISDWTVGALQSVRCSQSGRAVAVGGDFLSAPPYGDIIFSMDGGGSWSPGLVTFLYLPLHGVAFSNDATVFAIGTEDVFVRSTTGGSVWTDRPSPLPYDCWHTELFDIEFADASTGLIVGEYGFVVGTGDGGVTWAQQPRKTRIPLLAVSMRTALRAAIIGHGFTVLTTADGGQNWGGRATLTFSDLSGVSFADQQTGMIVGDRGDVLRTSDGGASWDALNVGMEKGIQFPFYDVEMLDPTTAVVVGVNNGSDGWIFKTSDAGMTWRRIYAPVVAGAFGTLNSVSFADSQNGMALGSARILRTTDAGESWTDCAVPGGLQLNAIQHVTPAVAFAVGTLGTILRTTDGGATWSQVPSGVTSLLLGLQFVDSMTGWVVGAELGYGGWENIATGGVILHTVDGGNTWVSQSSGVGVPLRDVSFVDALVGTAVGGKGWENYTGTEQPVVLRTADGGATWSVQPLIDGTLNLYRVVMLDSQVAVAIGRRGTILRTTTGGS